MHVMVIPADRGGCGNYRLAWPAQAVSGVREDWYVSVVPPERVQAGFRNEKFIGVQGFPKPLPDVVVMQRVGTPGQFHVLQWAQQQGVATVVDFDDAMWCIDTGNAAWASWNRSATQHWKWCDRAAGIADLVTVTTDALARRYARHGRVEVIPNYVPAAATRLPLQREPGGLTAGWAGFTRTHPGDCRVSAPAATAVLQEGGRLHVIADAPGAAREWGLEDEQVGSTGPQPLGPKYFGSLSVLDLMLVGLRDTPFNRAKSTLKVIEAGAAGAVSIAPDNAPHRVLARSGYPVALAASPRQWADHAAAFARESAETRAERAAEIRRLTAERWTIEGNAERWARAWERAAARGRRAA